jgi:hypothetical protein
MKQLCTWIALAILMFFSGNSVAHATDVARVAQMHSVLESFHSPMSGHEQILIDTAEKYHLDWTILAAIAGTESSFGLHMPDKCVNPYGWGIYGDNKLCFTSFDDAISGIAQGLATKYNTTSLETIARTYNKVSTEGWISHTHYFMNRIKSVPIPVSSLPVTL